MKPIARYRPALREIKLFEDHLEFKGSHYSLAGVEAEVVQTGNKRLLSDDRQTFLNIYGEEIGLSIRLPNNEVLFTVGPARRFAAKVNQAAKAFAAVTS